MEKTVFKPKKSILINLIAIWCGIVSWIWVSVINLFHHGASTLYGWSYLILAALWVIIAVIYTKKYNKSMKAVILLTDYGILMSECAALVKNNRLSEPTTLDIEWNQVAKVEKRTIVLHSGEVYSDINWNLSKRFTDNLNTSPFDILAWTKIESSFYRYKNKTQ